MQEIKGSKWVGTAQRLEKGCRQATIDRYVGNSAREERHPRGSNGLGDLDPHPLLALRE